MAAIPNLKSTPVKESAWTDMHQDAKSFYVKVEAQDQTSALSVLREMDPPDPQDDAPLIKYFEDQTKARVKSEHRVLSPYRAEKIGEHAQGMATLSKWMSKAMDGEKLVTIKDFYRNSAITALFPVYIESRIQQSLLASSLVPELIFSEETVDSTTATGLYMADTEAVRSLRKIGEGTELPATDFTSANSTIALQKYGRLIRASYEAISSQRVDAFGNMLARIGRQVGLDETDRLLDIAIMGDGTTMGAAETDAVDTDVAVAGSIAFSDMLTWYYSVAHAGYFMDKAVLGRTDIRLIADLVEFSDPQYIQNQSSLRLPTPVAMQYFWWQGSVTDSHYLDRMVIGIDSSQAFQAYTYGGFISEAAKIIERQVNVSTFAYWRGFRKSDAGAVQVLDVNTVL
jgi:hypothetical protein